MSATCPYVGLQAFFLSQQSFKTNFSITKAKLSNQKLRVYPKSTHYFDLGTRRAMRPQKDYGEWCRIDDVVGQTRTKSDEHHIMRFIFPLSFSHVFQFCHKFDPAWYNTSTRANIVAIDHICLGCGALGKCTGIANIKLLFSMFTHWNSSLQWINGCWFTIKCRPIADPMKMGFT